jgi:hypothetical protein
MTRAPTDLLLLWTALALALVSTLTSAAPLASVSSAQDDAHNATFLELDARCGAVKMTGVQLWGTAPYLYTFAPPPYNMVSDAECRTLCVGHLAWTRQQSNNNCWCVNQPLSKPGTAITGQVNSDWNTGFYPNVSPPTAGCSSFAITGQKVMFNGPPVLGPYSKATDALCSAQCDNVNLMVWTRIYDTSSCYCGSIAGPFQPSAILYDANASFGINSFS